MVTGNNFVSALLRSPLHRALSGHLMLVTYKGRRSGRTFTTPVSYRRDDGDFAVRVGWPDAKQWWRNFREPHDATLTVRRRQVQVAGTAEVAGDGSVSVVFRPMTGTDPGC